MIKSIAEFDYSTVSQATEGQLYNAFAEGMDQIRDKKYKLELLNERNPTWNFEVIDFHNFIGVEIDRKTCKQKGLREFSPFMMDLPNITVYTPGNPMQAMQSIFKSRGSGKPLSIEGMSLEIVAKIRTNYKLNVCDGSMNKLVTQGKENEDEVHFAKFEGFYPTFELSPENLMKGGAGLGSIEFRDWTIVDFDNFLKGNPHL